MDQQHKSLFLRRDTQLCTLFSGSCLYHFIDYTAGFGKNGVWWFFPKDLEINGMKSSWAHLEPATYRGDFSVATTGYRKPEHASVDKELCQARSRKQHLLLTHPHAGVDMDNERKPAQFQEGLEQVWPSLDLGAAVKIFPWDSPKEKKKKQIAVGAKCVLCPHSWGERTRKPVSLTVASLLSLT